MADELERSAARQVGWIALAQASSIGLRFLSLPILARFLAPEEFGVVAPLVALVYFTVVAASEGLNGVLVSRRDQDIRHWQTALWLNLAAGISMGALYFAAAGPICSVLGIPAGEPYLRLLAVFLPVIFLSELIQFHAMSRLMFRKLTIANLAAEIPSVAVAVTAALAGAGAWALVLQQVLWPSLRTLVLAPMTGFRPALVFDWRGLRPHLASVGDNMVASTMGFAATRGPLVVIAPVLGATAAGFFFAASRLARVLNDVVSASFGRVLFPNFTHATRDAREERTLLVWGLAANCAITTAAGFGMAALAEPATRIILGEEWRPAWPVLSLLSIAVGLAAPTAICNAWLKGTGRFRRLSGLATLRAVLTLGLVTIGAIHYGLTGAAAGLVFASLVTSLLTLHAVFRLADAPVSEGLVACGSPMAVSAAMAGSVAALIHLTPLGEATALLQLAAGVPAGALIFAGLFYVSHPVSFRRYLDLFRTRKEAQGETRQAAS